LMVPNTATTSNDLESVDIDDNDNHLNMTEGIAKFSKIYSLKEQHNSVKSSEPKPDNVMSQLESVTHKYRGSFRPPLEWTKLCKEWILKEKSEDEELSEVDIHKRIYTQFLHSDFRRISRKFGYGWNSFANTFAKEVNGTFHAETEKQNYDIDLERPLLLQLDFVMQLKKSRYELWTDEEFDEEENEEDQISSIFHLDHEKKENRQITNTDKFTSFHLRMTDGVNIIEGTNRTILKNVELYLPGMKFRLSGKINVSLGVLLLDEKCEIDILGGFVPELLDDESSKKFLSDSLNISRPNNKFKLEDEKIENLLKEEKFNEEISKKEIEESEDDFSFLDDEAIEECNESEDVDMNETNYVPVDEQSFHPLGITIRSNETISSDGSLEIDESFINDKTFDEKVNLGEITQYYTSDLDSSVGKELKKRLSSSSNESKEIGTTLAKEEKLKNLLKIRPISNYFNKVFQSKSQLFFYAIHRWINNYEKENFYENETRIYFRSVISNVSRENDQLKLRVLSHDGLLIVQSELASELIEHFMERSTNQLLMQSPDSIKSTFLKMKNKLINFNGIVKYRFTLDRSPINQSIMDELKDLFSNISNTSIEREEIEKISNFTRKHCLVRLVKIVDEFSIENN
ncbi:hypothetical protein SNEBB_002714, partial [Seison nebaliae]